MDIFYDWIKQMKQIIIELAQRYHSRNSSKFSEF